MIKKFKYLLLVLMLVGCAGKPAPTPSDVALPKVAMPPSLQQRCVIRLSETEARKYVASLHPKRQNMNSWTDMTFALQQSRAHAARFPADNVATCLPNGQNVTYGDVTQTLTQLIDLLPFLDAQPDLLISSFDWLHVGPDFKFTGYYEPTLRASRVQTERYRYPLYKRPSDLKRYAAKHGGRYHSRKAINNGALRGRGLEIAWLDNPIDGFFLQIQGSGKLVFEDGQESYILYDGQNRHKYVALGRVMKDRGLLPPDGVNGDTIHAWLAEHPAEVTALLETNPSYVFFKLSNTPSVGSMGRVLTPHVSVAVDQKVLPNGLLTFMSVMKPDNKGSMCIPFAGLMLPQDSGGAIKRHRVDIYLGPGEEAKRAANYQNTMGSVIVLLAKKVEASHSVAYGM